MINFVVTRDHRYTLEKKFLNGKLGELPFRSKLWNYEDLFNTRTIKTGTWIFQDIERLSDAELIRSAKIATALASQGATVLNHPARAASRYELQRKLFNAHINQFEVYRADEYRIPQRWPVFIRFENNHESPDPKLLYSPDELKSALESYLANSIPMSALLIVEYCGEQQEDKLWYKYAAYRVGEEIIHHHIIRQDSWVAKYGNPALTYDDATWTRLRTAEKDFVETVEDVYELMPAFKLGNLEFGRVDFSIVQGKPQLYEINTNPTFGTYNPKDEKFPAIPREPMVRHANERIIQALHRIDAPPSEEVYIGGINSFSSRPGGTLRGVVRRAMRKAVKRP